MRKNALALTTITSLFFVMGFITVLNDILVPHLKNVFDLNYFEAALIQFCFFGAYFITGIFWGKIIQKIGYPNSIILGFSIVSLGCFLFYSVASTLSYILFLGALFVLASGVVLLQAVGNPYVILLSKGKEAATLTLVQAFNSLGTTIGSFFGSALILGAAYIDKIDAAKGVQIPYLCIGVVLALLVLAIWLLKLPDVRDEADKISTELRDSKTSIWQHKHLVLGVIGIFCYVGAEVSIGTFLINLAKEFSLATQGKDANFLAIYWGLAMVGRFIGSFVLRKIQPFICLAFNATMAFLLIISAVILESSFSIYIIVAIGFFNSIMFSVIFSLAIRGVGRLTSDGSGLICTAIVGGAIIPPLQGLIADNTELLFSFFLPAICYSYIMYFALFGHRNGIGFFGK